MPRLAAPDPDLPELITAADARDAGLTADQIRQRVRSRRWTAVGRGLYVKTAVLEAFPDRFARARYMHVQRAVAFSRSHDEAMIGFASAALVHGLPLWSPVPRDVTASVPSTAWTGKRGGVWRRRARAITPCIQVAGCTVTTVAETWVDIARTMTLANALTVGDAALNRGLVTVEELERAVAGRLGTRGSARAERALGFVDGRRESPLESASWAYFIRHNIPLPTPQAVIVDDGGRFVARVDALWEEARLVGECDGRGKYLGPDAAYEEKRREDGIRAQSLGMIRWGADALRDTELARELRRRLGLSAHLAA